MAAPYQNAEWLREEFVKKGRTPEDIADECGVTKKTIKEWACKLDVGTRNVRYQQLHDEEFLTERFEDGYSSQEIADEIGCGRRTVDKQLLEFGLREKGHNGISRYKLHPKLNDKEWLRDKIVNDDYTTTMLANEIGCSQRSVIKTLKDHGIEERAGQVHNRHNKKEWSSSGNWVHAEDWLTRDALVTAYWDEFWTIEEISEWTGISDKIIRTQMKKHNVPRRKAEKSRLARRLYRPEYKIDGALFHKKEEQMPHMRDGQSVDAETVIDILYRGDTSRDYPIRSEEDDSRMQWTDVSADD